MQQKGAVVVTREDVSRGLVKATPPGMLSRTTHVCAAIPKFGSAAAVRRELSALAEAGLAERVDPFDRGLPERWKPTQAGRDAAPSGAVRMTPREMEKAHGLCECGCGRAAPIATESDEHYGWVKGQPKRFINGHNQKRFATPYVERAEITHVDGGFVTPCWRTTQKPGTAGYPIVMDRGVNRQAHQIWWEHQNGPVPKGLELDHLCRNRWCVNPDHVEPVTHAENVRRGASTPLTWDVVREIRASDERLGVLAQRYGVSKSTIWNVRRENTWREDVA